jgi:hypothetical protein
MAEATWIIAAGNALSQVAKDQPLGVCSELAKVAGGGAIELDPPNPRRHQRAARFLACRSRLSRVTRGPPRASRRRAR